MYVLYLNKRKNKLNNIPVKRYEIPTEHREFKPVENTNIFNEAGRFHFLEWN